MARPRNVDLQARTVSQILGVHPETLRRYVKTGKLPATRVNHRWRFRAEDVALFKRFGPPLGRVGDAARALGVHRNTVIAWERSGRLRSVGRDHGARVFRRSDLQAAANERRGRVESAGIVCPTCGEIVGLPGGRARAIDTTGKPRR